jgi:DNA-binding response OmpR family regulator
MATILIIDDDEEVREILATSLQLEDHKVLEAPHGEYGLQLLETNHVDLIITDIFMPETEGLETIMRVRESWPDLKIIAMSGGPAFVRTAAANPDFLVVAQGLGADKTLAKPFLPSELVSAVDSLLSENAHAG